MAYMVESKRDVFLRKEDPIARSTKEAMRLIYQEKLWGDGNSDFYSGSGSHKQKMVMPYIKEVTDWLSSLSQKPTICDLGCGDFNVGIQLVAYAKKYIGIDVVEELIQRNTRLFQAHNLKFQCLDIVQDELPEADCVIVRQVLQHLANEEIRMLVPKLKKYRFLILTEHLPFTGFIPNIDKSTDYDIRLRKKSGVVLTSAPFNLQPIKQKEMLSIEFRKRSKIVTTLYQNF